jgi:hypothetical protein
MRPHLHLFAVAIAAALLSLILASGLGSVPADP